MKYPGLRGVMARIAWVQFVWLLAGGWFSTGCTCHLSVPPAKGEIQNNEWVSQSTSPLKVRVFKPLQPGPKKVLLVYATGDGGWLALGGNIFEWLTQLNYPVVGFSSRAYVNSVWEASESGVTTPRALAEDYEQIIGYAKTRLGLPPDTSIILVGLSRGSGLSVVAAGEGKLNGNLAGLLTIALTKEEEYVHHRTRRESMPRTQFEVQNYEYLNRITTIPVVVLQSTNDHYLSAQEARELFGPDTELRKLYSIEALNHGVVNGCTSLYQEVRSALDWIISRVPQDP
jgi:fermentation-respiration switch protein FrsA (DUF1100 family)